MLFKSMAAGFVLFSIQHLFLIPKLYSEYHPSDASCDYYNSMKTINKVSKWLYKIPAFLSTPAPQPN